MTYLKPDSTVYLLVGWIVRGVVHGRRRQVGQTAARGLSGDGGGLLRGRGALGPGALRRRLGLLLHLVERPVVHVDDEGVLLRVGGVGRHVLGAGVQPPRGGGGVDDDRSQVGRRRGRGGAGAARRALVLCRGSLV